MVILNAGSPNRHGVAVLEQREFTMPTMTETDDLEIDLRTTPLTIRTVDAVGGGGKVVRVSGTIEPAAVHALADTLADALDDLGANVEVDLSELSPIDAITLAAALSRRG